MQINSGSNPVVQEAQYVDEKEDVHESIDEESQLSWRTSQEAT